MYSSAEMVEEIRKLDHLLIRDQTDRTVQSHEAYVQALAEIREKMLDGFWSPRPLGGPDLPAVRKSQYYDALLGDPSKESVETVQVWHQILMDLQVQIGTLEDRRRALCP